MRKSTQWLLLPAISMALISSAVAHVTLTYPTGSEVFSAGQLIEIQWRLDIAHNQQNWDLYFSPDSGSTWEAIQLDIPNAEMTYSWVVPNVGTQTALIQIVQDNQSLDYWSISNSFSIESESAVLSAGQGRPVPLQFSMSPNYPNPFNPVSTIRYELPGGTALSLIIYDVLGREVMMLVDRYQEAGSYQVQWDGGGFPSGIYIARLVTPEYAKSIKMILLK